MAVTETTRSALPGGAGRSSSARRSAASTWSRTALDRALETVQHQDVELASMVIADDDRIDGRYLEVHQGILSLLALQAPVAGDLRLVAALLHVIKHVERMGDQCVNMAKLVPLAGHEPPADAAMLEQHPADGRAGPPAGGPVRPGVRARATSSMAQDLVRQDDEIDQPQPRRASSSRWSSATTPTGASGRCT